MKNQRLILTRFAALLVTLLLALTASRATADTIFNDLKPGDTFDSTAGGVSSYYYDFFGAINALLAMPFTVPTGTNYTLDNLTLALAATTPTANLTLSLRYDNAGVPDSDIESITGTVTGTTPTLYNFNSTLHSQLDAGVTYWIVAQAQLNDGALWFVGDTNNASHAKSLATGTGWSPAYQGDYAMKIEATPEPVPEPATAALAGLGLIALLYKVRGSKYQV